MYSINKYRESTCKRKSKIKRRKSKRTKFEKFRKYLYESSFIRRKKKLPPKCSLTETRRKRDKMQRFISYLKKLAEKQTAKKYSSVADQDVVLSESSSEDQEIQETENIIKSVKRRRTSGYGKKLTGCRLMLKNGKMEGVVKRKIRKEKCTIYDALHRISLKLDPKRDIIREFVRQEKLNFIILNLYDLKSGITLFTKGREKHFLCSMSYEDALSFLDEIDRGEVPMKLLVMLKDSKDKFLYDNYIIIKVNDFITKQGLMKKNIPPFFSFFSLLKLSYETLKAILGGEAMMRGPLSSRLKCRMLINEAEFLVAFSDPLCLDPTPVSLYEHFEMERNSFPSPKSQELLEEKFQTTVDETSNPPSFEPPTFMSYLDAKEKIKEELSKKYPEEYGEKYDRFRNKRISLSIINKIRLKCLCNLDRFEKFLLKRVVKRAPRSLYRIPILVEEFGFECLTFRGEDNTKEVVKRNFFSVFQDKDGSYFSKLRFPDLNKNEDPKLNSCKVGDQLQLNKQLLRHARLMIGEKTDHYVRIIYKIPNGKTQIVFDNVPLSRSKVKKPEEYRESQVNDAEESPNDEWAFPEENIDY